MEQEPVLDPETQSEIELWRHETGFRATEISVFAALLPQAPKIPAPPAPPRITITPAKPAQKAPGKKAPEKPTVPPGEPIYVRRCKVDPNVVTLEESRHRSLALLYGKFKKEINDIYGQTRWELQKAKEAKDPRERQRLTNEAYWWYHKTVKEVCDKYLAQKDEKTREYNEKIEEAYLECLARELARLKQ